MWFLFYIYLYMNKIKSFLTNIYGDKAVDIFNYVVMWANRSPADLPHNNIINFLSDQRSDKELIQVIYACLKIAGVDNISYGHNCPYAYINCDSRFTSWVTIYSKKHYVKTWRRILLSSLSLTTNPQEIVDKVSIEFDRYKEAYKD